MAKNNEKFRWLARTAMALVAIIVAAAVAWGVLKERVNNNKARIIVVEENIKSIPATGLRLNTIEGSVNRIKETDLPNIVGDIEYHDDRLYEQEKEVFGLKKEVGYLGEKVDRNYEVQEQILSEIKELRK